MVFVRAIWGVLIVLTAVTGAACVTSNASRCSNGLVCPSGMSCAPTGVSCIDSDLVDACHGGADGQACNVPGLSPGTCLGGICQASRCGDGRLTGSEDCDGADLNHKTCQTLGFYEPSGLRCSPDCHFDTSQCVGRCGDGIKNGNEACDGADLGSATCLTRGFYAEPGLACAADCTLDTKACTGGRCGDGIVNGLEQCDGAKFSNSCTGMGFVDAQTAVACSPTCTYAASSCLCNAGQRCKAKTQQCLCDKFGTCTCVAK
jgi:hypothetical protein